MSNNLRRTAALGLTAFVLTTATFAATTSVLSPDAFTRLASKNILVGEYPDGRAWREEFLDTANTVYSEGTTSLAGTVSAKGNFVCFTYALDSGLEGGCFEIWQRSANCFDFYGTGGKDSETVASEREKVLSLGWSARGRLADRPSTCVSEQIS